MAEKQDILNVILDVINDVKKTGLTSEIVDLEFYLGGDLGIDSREMLEIWYDLENRLNVQVHDYQKRDLYTIGDIVNVLQEKIAVPVE